LFGGNGSDTLDGGEGNDRLMGDAGPDTFVFAPGSGSDLVTDFELGLDLLDLTGFGFADFATVQAVSAQQGNSTVIDLDMTGGDNVTLAQIDLTDLTQDSFLL
ncbi:MAG: M10 family metallopeptidase C-terminal domain-containing protein, partial [Hyphomicrobiales bacterium]|nr:M10 family metallopeptidase C-terminal domain-containing protein [Hyphomicrobiales bacterium]